MVFFGDSHQAAGRRHSLWHAVSCAAFLLVGAVTLSGCGGSGGDPTPTPSSTPNTSATVSGRVIESTSTELVSGALVRLGDVSVTTGSDGQFTIQVPGGGEARTLLITLPDGYLARGDYQSTCVDNLTTGGIPVAKVNLESGDRTSLGDIKVFNLTNPPPPPCTL